MILSLISHLISKRPADDAQKVHEAVVVRRSCPDCSAKWLYKGRKRGMKMEAFCSNRDCRSGFLVTLPELPGVKTTARRIRRGPLAKYWNAGRG